MISLDIKIKSGDLLIAVDHQTDDFIQTISLTHEEAIELRDKLGSGLRKLDKHYGFKLPRMKTYPMKLLGPPGTQDGAILDG